MLFRAENSVARVAQTGENISHIVEAAVKLRYVKLNVGVRLLHRFYACGRGDNIHSLYFFTPRFLSKSIAATRLPPVASMGSMTITVLSSMPSGSLQ